MTLSKSSMAGFFVKLGGNENNQSARREKLAKTPPFGIKEIFEIYLASLPF
jgi:hypothetical protein